MCVRERGGGRQHGEKEGSEWPGIHLVWDRGSGFPPAPWTLIADQNRTRRDAVDFGDAKQCIKYSRAAHTFRPHPFATSIQA